MTEMFKSSHATDADWRVSVEACVAGLGPLDGNETLGFIYVTEPFALNLANIERTLREATGIRDWVGSVGLGVCVPGHEYFDEPAMAVMVADLPAGSFAVLPEMDGKAARDFAGRFKQADGFGGSAFALVHADSRNSGVLSVVEEVATETDGFLVGGLTASQNHKHHIANGVVGGGLSGVLFAPEIGVATSLSQGYAPISKMHEVTEAVDNVVVSLDGKRAFDVFVDDIGPDFADDVRRVAGVVHVALPVQGSDTGDYVVRNLFGLDPAKGWIAIADTITEGERLMFVRREGNDAADDLVAMITRLKRRAGNHIRGAVYISCIARGPHMFGDKNAEMNLVRETLGDVPLIGFYANGEISNDRLYSYTGVLTLFL